MEGAAETLNRVWIQERVKILGMFIIYHILEQKFPDNSCALGLEKNSCTSQREDKGFQEGISKRKKERTDR